jgi:hypothetical protein
MTPKFTKTLRSTSRAVALSFAIPGFVASFSIEDVNCADNAKPSARSVRRHSPTQPLQSRQDTRTRDGKGPGITSDLRAIDGSNNNTVNPTWGSADIELLRLTPSDYGDGVDSPAGAGRPSPREISNVVVAQPRPIPNRARASDFVWQWGQFLDHDLDLTPTITPVEEFDIPVPLGDPFFDPAGTGSQTISLDRSFYNAVNGVRQQVNAITAYIDASNVYGSDPSRATELRALDGTGRLKTSGGNLLPFNDHGFPNAPSPDPSLFLAGDVRSNEQVGLTAMHTLFMREHNYWADRFRHDSPRLSDDQLYQAARAMVAAEMQAITYNEFLPVLLGRNALAPYGGYKASVNAGIANEFATASYRFGHSMISPHLLRLDRNGKPIPQGNLPLAQAFFNPAEISATGIDPLLRGLASQVAQEIDVYIVDDLRNFLFGQPGSGGFDLASLNIQRGRDHGLPSYNQVRVGLGLLPAASFKEVSSDPKVQANLSRIYASVDDLDLWVGGLAEDHVPGAQVGRVVFTILKNQFERLRDGDRFWYHRYLPPHLVKEVEDQTLARIIRRNTRIRGEIQDNVFVVPGR